MNVLLAALAPLLVLSPADRGGYTPTTTRDGSVLVKMADAGKRPLAFAATDNEFVRFAEGAAAVAFDETPERHLVRSWHLLGIKAFRVLDFDPLSTPEFLRREAGFAAWYSGVDGLWLATDGAKWPKRWQTALAEARADHALCVRLAELAAKCRAREDVGVQALGRRALAWLDAMNPSADELDMLRAETWAYVARLEALLPGERRTPAPQFPLTAPDAAAVWYRGDVDGYARTFKGKGMMAKVNLPLKEAVPGISFASNRSGFTFEFAATDGKKLGKDEWPGGGLEIDFTLPAADRKDVTPYRVRVDLEPPEKGLAWLMGWGLYYANERRFAPPAAVRCQMAPRRSFGPHYQPLKPEFAFARGENGGWRVTLKFSWSSLYGQWPATDPNWNAVWCIAATRLERAADGTVKRTAFAEPCKLSWLHGTAANHEFFFNAMNFNELAKQYSGLIAETSRRCVFMRMEKEFWRDAPLPDSFARNDRKNAELFETVVLTPMQEGAEGKLAQMLVSGGKRQDDKPKILTVQPHLREKMVGDLEKIRHFKWNLQVARRNFLVTEIGGKTPEPPAQKKKKVADETPKARDVKAPTLDVEESGDIQLDEVEY